MIELGAAWIPHKAQHLSKAVCVKSDNGHTNHEVTFAVTSYGNLKKSPPKPLMQRVHYIVESTVSSWEPGTNGWLYLKQYAQGPLKMDKNGYSGSLVIY